MKKVFFAVASILISLSVLSGCANTQGSAGITDKDKLASIKPGKTTKSEVEGLLGRPAHVDLAENGEQVWNYQRTDVSGMAYVPFLNLANKNFENSTLSIRFSKAGIVKDMGSGSSKF